MGPFSAENARARQRGQAVGQAQHPCGTSGTSRVGVARVVFDAAISCLVGVVVGGGVRRWVAGVSFVRAG
jgi:hypothetical protein